MPLTEHFRPARKVTTSHLPLQVDTTKNFHVGLEDVLLGECKTGDEDVSQHFTVKDESIVRVALHICSAAKPTMTCSDMNYAVRKTKQTKNLGQRRERGAHKHTRLGIVSRKAADILERFRLSFLSVNLCRERRALCSGK